MKRLKTFLIYVILIVAFTALSDFLIYMALKGTYNHINTNILAKDISINVTESKATYINGYVKGNIYNDTNGVLNKYIKMLFEIISYCKIFTITYEKKYYSKESNSRYYQ